MQCYTSAAPTLPMNIASNISATLRRVHQIALLQCLHATLQRQILYVAATLQQHCFVSWVLFQGEGRVHSIYGHGHAQMVFWGVEGSSGCNIRSGHASSN